MNSPFDYTKKQEQLQEVSSRWAEQIASLLPQNLDSLRKESGCVKRFRGISCTLVLLKGVFLYAMSGLSFSMLSAAMHALGLTQISDTAWRKRLSSLVPFLRLLLSALLSSVLPEPSISSSRRVFFVDASTIRQQGKTGVQQRLHTCFSLNRNAITQCYVTDVHGSEHLSRFSMEPGDLFLADAGYGYAKNYAYAREQQADVILRFTPNHLNFYTKEGEKIDLLDYLPGSNEHSQEGEGYLLYQGKRIWARFVIARLPEEKAEKARARKRKEAIRKQSTLKEKTERYAGYVFLVTSLGKEYDREEILHLYESRWQIELVFKRIKQNFQIHTIRAGGEKYAEAIVLVWMILWVIVERQVMQAELCLAKKRTETVEEVTVWTLCECQFRRVKAIVEMSWSLFLNLEQEEVYAHLVPHKSRRKHQNQEFRVHILPGLNP